MLFTGRIQHLIVPVCALLFVAACGIPAPPTTDRPIPIEHEDAGSVETERAEDAAPSAPAPEEPDDTFAPPESFSVIARAAGRYSFRLYQFEDAAFVAACHRPMYTWGCIEPRIARLVDGELVPDDRFLEGLPRLTHYQDLGDDFYGVPLWDELPKGCWSQAYPGSRMLRDVFGSYRGEAWAVITEGEFEKEEIGTELYRLDGDTWRLAHTSPPGEKHLEQAFPYKGGAVLFANGKFEAIETEEAAPRSRGYFAPDAEEDWSLQRIFDDGNVVSISVSAFHHDGMKVQWGGSGRSRFKSIQLPGLINPFVTREGAPTYSYVYAVQDFSFHESVTFHSSREVEILGWGFSPVEKTPSEDTDPDDSVLLAVRLRVGKGGWKVVSQEEVSEERVAPQEQVSRVFKKVEDWARWNKVSLTGTWRIGDDLYASVNRQVDGKEEALLLRSRPASDLWQVPYLEPPERLRPPSCEEKPRPAAVPLSRPGKFRPPGRCVDPFRHVFGLYDNPKKKIYPEARNFHEAIDSFDIDGDGRSDELRFDGSTNMSSTYKVYVQRGKCGHYVGEVDGGGGLSLGDRSSHGLRDIIGTDRCPVHCCTRKTYRTYEFDGESYRLVQIDNVIRECPKGIGGKSPF